MQVCEQVDWLEVETECMNNFKSHTTKTWQALLPRIKATSAPFAWYDVTFCDSNISIRKLKATLSATINASSINETRSPYRNGVFNFRTAHYDKALYHFHRKSTFGDVLFTVTSGCCVDDFAKQLPYSFPSETTRCLSCQNTTQVLQFIGKLGVWFTTRWTCDLIGYPPQIYQRGPNHET
jgi:hypothetical protein